MDEPNVAARPPDPPPLRDSARGGATLFGLVIGFFLGVLAANLIPPAGPASPAGTEATAQQQILDEGDTAGRAPAAIEATTDPSDTPSRASGPGAGAAPDPGETGTTGEAIETPASDGGPRDSGGGGGSVPPDDSTQPAGSDGRGVTADTVKVGVAYPDLGALAYLGPDFDNGDPREQFEVMLQGWKDSGEVPIDGRMIEFVYRKYDVLDPAQQRAACTGLIQDEGVFMVIGVAYFQTGAECVASEFTTPLITPDGQSEAVMARGHPYLFSLGMSVNRTLRNMIHFSEFHGLLADGAIGIYYENSREQVQFVEEELEPQLRGLGYQVGAKHTTDQSGGGPQDAVAVQKFRQAGVELAILLTSKAGFMHNAESQGYRPDYVDSDYEFGTSDTATSTYPAAHFDGALGITSRRIGEEAAGLSLDAKQASCLDNFAKYTGRRPPPDSTEGAYIMYGCDEGEVLRYGIAEAGSVLNNATFIAALDTIEDLPLRRYAPITFRPDKHDGANAWRTVRFVADCGCWQAEHADWKPRFVD